MAETQDERLRALASRLQRRMNALGWNQSEAARRLGWSRTALNGLLTGATTSWPAGDVLIRMPKVFRCSYHWFFTGDGQPSDTEERPAQQMIDGYLQALADVERATGELRGAVTRPRGPGRPRG